MEQPDQHWMRPCQRSHSRTSLLLRSQQWQQPIEEAAGIGEARPEHAEAAKIETTEEIVVEEETEVVLDPTGVPDIHPIHQNQRVTAITSMVIRLGTACHPSPAHGKTSAQPGPENLTSLMKINLTTICSPV